MTSLPPVPSATADTTLGYIYILCTIVGIPLNLTALIYFIHARRAAARTDHQLVKERTLLFNYIYLAVICNDLVILASSIPVAESFLSGREPYLFGNQLFCTAWGVLWNVLPFYSVFLVLVMSCTRTAILAKPQVRVSRRLCVSVMWGYKLLLLVRGTLSLFLKKTDYAFTPNDNYCWENRYEILFIRLESRVSILPATSCSHECF